MNLRELTAHLAWAKGLVCKPQHLTLDQKCVNCGFTP